MTALLSREPGYSVAKKCLEVQAECERRDPKLRQGEKVWLHESAQSWYLGALGEIAVGKLLARLGPEWFVRHSIPIGAGTTDVDHLLVGPAGVFALNTKHHRGQDVWVGDYVLRLNGTNTKYLESSRREARNASSRLAAETGFPVEVYPALVFVDANSLTDIRFEKNRPVSVIRDFDLIRWLTSLPPRLSEGQLGLIRLAAERPSTWHVDPHAADTFRVMQRFERLFAQIGQLHTSSSSRTPTTAKRQPVRTSARRSTTPARRLPAGRPPFRSQPVRRKSRKRKNSIGEAIFAFGFVAAVLLFHEQFGRMVMSIFLAIAMPSSR